MNRRTATSRTASRSESSVAWAVGRLRLERLDLGVELAEPGLGLGQVGGGRVGPPARVGQAAVIGAGARRDHDEAQQHGEGEGRPRQSSPHSGRRGYKMLRTCDETASKSLVSGRIRHGCRPRGPR